MFCTRIPENISPKQGCRLKGVKEGLTRVFPARMQASLMRYRVLGLSLASTTRSQPDRLSRAFSCVKAASIAVHLQNVPNALNAVGNVLQRKGWESGRPAKYKCRRRFV